MLIKSANELSDYVRSQRKSKKLSQMQAGDSVGLKQSTLSAFEHKPASSRLDTVFRILSAVGLEIHLLPKEDSHDSQNENELW